MTLKAGSLKKFLALPVHATYGVEDIKANIPHREPLLLVDEVRMLEKAKNIWVSATFAPMNTILKVTFRIIRLCRVYW